MDLSLFVGDARDLATNVDRWRADGWTVNLIDGATLRTTEALLTRLAGDPGDQALVVLTDAEQVLADEPVDLAPFVRFLRAGPAGTRIVLVVAPEHEASTRHRWRAAGADL